MTVLNDLIVLCIIQTFSGLLVGARDFYNQKYEDSACMIKAVT